MKKDSTKYLVDI